VLFDGMDNAKEMSVIFAGLDFAKRGINTLAIDGPGQSETLRLRNIPSRYDYEVPGRAAYDYVAARQEVDPKRVAVMGYSFGGYHAPRIAGRDGLDRIFAAHQLQALIAFTEGPAMPIDPVNGDAINGSGPGNLPAIAGYPHLTVPMGMVKGLPVGLSVIGLAWSDAQVLQIGAACEQLLGPVAPPRYARTTAQLLGQR
jgi:pimeloyl-ACP methyl ester carboxylesterase